MNELTINLQSKSNIPLYEQIYSYIKNDIQSRPDPKRGKASVHPIP